MISTINKRRQHGSKLSNGLRQRVIAARGKFASVPTSSRTFAARKNAEIKAEGSGR